MLLSTLKWLFKQMSSDAEEGENSEEGENERRKNQVRKLPNIMKKSLSILEEIFLFFLKQLALYLFKNTT